MKHIDSNFMQDFLTHVRDQTGDQELFAVGEFWKDSLEDLGKVTKFFPVLFHLLLKFYFILFVYFVNFFIWM